MKRHASWVVIAALMIASTAAPAWADRKQHERKAAAFALLKEGRSLYDLGEFDQALTLFTQAYQAFPYPEALFNIGQTWRMKKNYEKAIFYYRSFLRNKDDAKNREQVEKRIVELQQLIKVQKASQEKPPEGTEEPPRPTADDEARPEQMSSEPKAGNEASSRRADDAVSVKAIPAKPERWFHDTVGWGVAGGGVLLGTASLFLLARAAALDSDAAKEMDELRQKELLDAARSRRLFGLVGGGLGVAVLVVGVIKLAAPPDSAVGSIVSGLTFGPNSVTYTGRF